MTTILCILDGFGIGEKNEHNAIDRANLKFLKNMMKDYPSSKLGASGISVGLDDGQMGNSEIGHLTIGSGRILQNDLLRLNCEVETLDQNKNLGTFVEKISHSNGKVHIIGMLSAGGVHSHCLQIYKLIDYLQKYDIEIVLHAISDGRDTSPKSIQKFINEKYRSFIKTIIGRYYAMDRDNRWNRTELAYQLIVNGVGTHYASIEECIDHSYKSGISDEFILPSVIGKEKFSLEKNDGIVIANFRADRVIQLTSEIIKKASFTDILSFTKYRNDLDIKNLIEPIQIKNSFGEVLSKNKMKQLRIAETEKYAHVTSFFSGKIEETMVGESRILIDSPKVSTYDLCPEMSAYKITEKLLQFIQSNDFDFILVNYANADMVGHTGNMQAAIKSLEVLDECITSLVKAVEENGSTIFITADHGNIENMYDVKHHTAHTAHTLNPVPFVVIGKDNIKKVHDGKLSDIAPTLLNLMNLPVPSEMDGHNIIEYL